MEKTYAIIKNGVVINKIIANSIEIANRVAGLSSIAVEDINNEISIGDIYN